MIEMSLVDQISDYFKIKAYELGHRWAWNERLIADYGKTIHLFNDWWNQIFNKYQCSPGNYSVDFSESTIVSTDNS